MVRVHRQNIIKSDPESFKTLKELTRSSNLKTFRVAKIVTKLYKLTKVTSLPITK